jgi:hypothetical protein
MQTHSSVIHAGMFRSLFAALRLPWRASQLKLGTRVAQGMVAVAARSGYSELVLQGDISKRPEPISVVLARPSGPVKDKDQMLALIRLRDMLYFGVRPTLRQCGFRPETVHELAKEGLIQLRDKKFGDDADRYVIEEILPAGLSVISLQDAVPDRHNK